MRRGEAWTVIEGRLSASAARSWRSAISRARLAEATDGEERSAMSMVSSRVRPVFSLALGASWHGSAAMMHLGVARTTIARNATKAA